MAVIKCYNNNYRLRDQNVPPRDLVENRYFNDVTKAMRMIRKQLTLKAPNKIAEDDILSFYFYLLEKLRLDFSCESSA